MSSIAGRTLPSTLGYSCQANQYQPKPCSRLESIRETLPAQERLSTRQFHRRNPYTKPSSCSDIPYDDERRENLSTRTRGAISSVCHHHHSSSDVYEPNFVGSSRSPSSERLSQVSSSCSAPERSLTAQEKPYNLNMNRLTSKYQDYLEVPQSNYYSRISPTSERSDRYDDNTVPTCTDSLMTANEAQEIINDINRLLVWYFCLLFHLYLFFSFVCPTIFLSDKIYIFFLLSVSKYKVNIWVQGYLFLTGWRRPTSTIS